MFLFIFIKKRKKHLEKSSSQIINFTLLYNKHKRGLYNYAVKMLSDKMIAEDLIQTIFLKLFENMQRIDKPESVLFWLYKTLRNEVYSVYRSRNIRVSRFNSVDSEEINIKSLVNLEIETELNDLRNIIKVELDKMNPDQKEVYILREYGNLCYKEIAEIMDIDENLVKSRLFKTRQKLIEKLSKIVD